jgi:membrane protein DedA with SNARE-associated domain
MLFIVMVCLGFAAIDHAGVPVFWLATAHAAEGEGLLAAAVAAAIVGGTLGDLMWWLGGRLAEQRKPTSVFAQQDVLQRLLRMCHSLGPVSFTDMLISRLFPSANQVIYVTAGARAVSFKAALAAAIVGNCLYFSAYAAVLGLWASLPSVHRGITLVLACTGLLWLVIRRHRFRPSASG